MIDSPEKTVKLMKSMKLCLLIPGYPTTALLQFLRGQPNLTSLKHLLKSTQPLLIEEIFYLGEEGGIGCAIRFPMVMKEDLIVSLTHLRVEATHPLFKEIAAYQKGRIRKLKKQGGVV